MNTITRYGYVNTHSTAGAPTEITIVVADIDRILKWHNVYGNPSYYFILKDGTFIRLVDDYGAMNDIGRLNYTYFDSRAAARRSDWRLG